MLFYLFNNFIIQKSSFTCDSITNEFKGKLKNKLFSFIPTNYVNVSARINAFLYKLSSITKIEVFLVYGKSFEIDDEKV